jgi:hypothetical protein
MKLPDTSDATKMAHIGRLTVLRRARTDAAKQLRDKLVPLLNSIELAGQSWDVSGVAELLDLITALSTEIDALGKA